jgi:drug/metabolite transporter, DME family
MNSYQPASAGRGLIYVAIAATAWGTTGFVAAVLYRTSGLGPIAVSFWRFAAGATILAIAYLIRRRCSAAGRSPRERDWWRHAVRERDWWRHAVTGGGMAVYHTAYFWAVAEVGVAVATVVTLGAGPVLIAAGARLALGERLGLRGAAMVTVALAGLILLTGGAGQAGPRPVFGCALALLSAAGYAVVTLLGRAGRVSSDPSLTALAGFGIGAMCLLPLAVVEGIAPYLASNAATAGWVLYLGAVPTALGYSLFFAGLVSVRAAVASVVALLEPVAATGLAVVALGERLTLLAAAGMAVLLGAVAMLAAGERRPAGRRPSG